MRIRGVSGRIRGEASLRSLVLLFVFLVIPTRHLAAGPAAKEFVLAVHMGEDKSRTHCMHTIERLGAYLYEQLKSKGFRLVDRKLLKKKTEKCQNLNIEEVDKLTANRMKRSCILEAGRSLGAQKGLRIEIKKSRGLACRVRIELFDHMSGAGGSGYGGNGACDLDDITRVIDRAVLQMNAEKPDSGEWVDFGMTDAEIEVGVAQMLERDKRFEEAMTQYLKAHRLEPSSKYPLVLLADFAERQKDFEQAYSAYRRILEMPNNDPCFKDLVQRKALASRRASRICKPVKGQTAIGGKGSFWAVSDLPLYKYHFSVSAADDGSVFVAGEVRRGKNADPETEGQMLLAKYRGDGRLDWTVFARAGKVVRKGKRKAGHSSAYTVEALPGGAVLVAGLVGGCVHFGSGDRGASCVTEEGSQAFLARYESDGKLGWLFRTKGAGVSWPRDMASLPDGGCLVAGWFQGSLDVGNGKPLEGEGYNHVVFVIRFDSRGRPLWKKIVPADRKWIRTGISHPVSIDAFPDGSSVVAATMVTTATYRKRWEIKRSHLFWLDPDGKELRIERYDPEFIEINDVAALPSGEALLAGRLKKPLALEGGGCLLPSRNADAFVARLNSSGVFTWGYRFGQEGSRWADELSVAHDGSFALFGRFGGIATEGGQEAEGSCFSAMGKVDIFFRSFDQKGRPLSFWQCGSEDYVMVKRSLDVSPRGRVAAAGFIEGGFWIKDIGKAGCQIRTLRGNGVFVLGIDPEGK